MDQRLSNPFFTGDPLQVILLLVTFPETQNTDSEKENGNSVHIIAKRCYVEKSIHTDGATTVTFEKLEHTYDENSCNEKILVQSVISNS